MEQKTELSKTDLSQIIMMLEQFKFSTEQKLKIIITRVDKLDDKQKNMDERVKCLEKHFTSSINYNISNQSFDEFGKYSDELAQK